MRTTLDLDEKLIKKLVRETHSRTKSQAIELAAREYLRTRRRRKILEHFGKVKVDDLSWTLRERERRRL